MKQQHEQSQVVAHKSPYLSDNEVARLNTVLGLLLWNWDRKERQYQAQQQNHSSPSHKHGGDDKVSRNLT